MCPRLTRDDVSADNQDMKAEHLPTCEVCGEPCTEVHIDIRLPGPGSYSIKRDLCSKHWQDGQKTVDRDASRVRRIA
jgi:hypothetical protein